MRVEGAKGIEASAQEVGVTLVWTARLDGQGKMAYSGAGMATGRVDIPSGLL